MDPQTTVQNKGMDEIVFNRKMQRRNFLRYSGMAASVALVAASCKDDMPASDMNNGIDLGSGDTGILNYAYALEQLEAAFYTQVITSPFSGITAAESALLAD